MTATSHEYDGRGGSAARPRINITYTYELSAEDLRAFRNYHDLSDNEPVLETLAMHLEQIGTMGVEDQITAGTCPENDTEEGAY